MDTPTILKDAVKSACDLYRYALFRTWDGGKPKVAFVMLNPSKADATTDDPTVLKCIRLAMKWGYGGLRIVNLFAFRATDPKELLTAADPIGPENDHWIGRLCHSLSLDTVVAAWGSTHMGTKGVNKFRTRALKVTKTLLGSQLHYLQLTSNGHPGHPLFLKEDVTPKLWTNPYGMEMDG